MVSYGSHPALIGASTYYVISHQDITARVQLEQKALELSQLDGLTSISNRRAFDDFLNLEWHHCLRNKFPVSFAMIDVDNFKQINDQYGHQVGDECLKGIAQVITQFANRASDKCARYGGDEFVIVWGQCEQDKALKMVNELLVRISELNIMTLTGKVKGKVSTSIGLCTALPNVINLQEFLACADQLMYNAKESGKSTIRHKVISSTQPKGVIVRRN